MSEAPMCPICGRGPMDDHPDFGLMCLVSEYDRERPCGFTVGLGGMKDSVSRWHKEHPPGWERARILVVKLEPDEADAVRKKAGDEESMHAWAHDAIVRAAASGDEWTRQGDRDMSATPQIEPIMKFFAYTHLKEDLQAISKPFADLAELLVQKLPRNAERSVALRKLLEGKDAAVRAALPE